MSVNDWAGQLDHFDLNVRAAALEALADLTVTTPLSADVNLHLHTFYSFNGEGYSPSHLAWRAHQERLAVAGIVDFDVLDGVEEFYAAARRLGLKGTAGIETRVFVPTFKDAVINSPGEPGIAYHMGIGMPQRALSREAETFLDQLKETAARRNRDLLMRINPFLTPAVLEYDRDVLPHTPKGNATERHLCKAYAHKAAERFPDTNHLLAFWREKLGAEVQPDHLPDRPALLDRIRACTMKKGGVGYVQPDAASFPLMQDMNAFVMAAGGIPCVAWLDGCSAGEQRMAELLDVAMASGVNAINLIPDRNYTPGVQDEKLANVQAVIALAEERDLPVVVGTEMNAPGQKFVDDFRSAELAPYVPLFLRSAYIIYAHVALQRHAGKGYLSDWAQQRYPTRRDRNAFFANVGEQIVPGRLDLVDSLLH